MPMNQAARSFPDHRFRWNYQTSRLAIAIERLAIRATAHWGVSKSVMSLLRNDPDLLSRLEVARHQRAFSSKYRPTVIEIFYDEMCMIRSVDGQIIYNQVIPGTSIPTLLEVRFDGEIAMFLVDCEPVIDHTTSTLPLATLLGVDPTNPTLNWNTMPPL
jgi:hypothetical protein